MRKILFAAVLSAVAVLGGAELSAQSTNAKPKVIPAVRYYQGATGKLSLKTVRPEFSGVKDPRTEQLDTLFQSELSALGVKTSPQGVEIRLSDALPDSLAHIAGAYQLIVGNDIELRAKSYEGFLYATRTLLQMLAQDPTNLSVAKGTVTDYPTLARRMVMLDVARKYFPPEVLRQYIRTLAWVKMNELHLHLNDNSWNDRGAYYRVPSEKYPGITSPEHYSWEQIAELIAFAHLYGITITPELDTPGHSRALVAVRPDLKSPYHPQTDLSDAFLDIDREETFEMVGALIGEISAHFDAPDFHIGTDEYMLASIKDTVLRNALGEKFRRYINRLNDTVRAHGKRARIWTGFENMPGQTMPDTTITIDMWDAHNAREFSQKGYRFINSSDMFNYIVPGNIIARYNTDGAFVYQQWNPRTFSKKAEENLRANDPGLYGAKVNIWNDYGPTGPSLSEIARIAVPGIMVFADRMWGAPRLYPTYQKWAPLQKQLAMPPLTSMLEEDYREKRIVYQSKEPINMALLHKSIPLGASLDTPDLEYPWTLEATLLRTAKSDRYTPELILSSPNAEFYAYFNHIVHFKNNLQDEHRGITLVRSQREPGLTAYTSQYPQVLTFNGSIPVGKEVKLKIVARHNHTAVYIDGQLVDEFDKQSLLPLLRLGSDNGQNFRGIIQSMTIYNYAR